MPKYKRRLNDVPNEEALIGAILQDPDETLEYALSVLKPEDFFAKFNQVIFAAASKLHSNGESVNITSIYSEVAKEDFNVNDIKAAIGKCFSVAGYKDYVTKVKEYSLKRIIATSLNSLMEEAWGDDEPVRNIVKRIGEVIHKIQDASKMFSKGKTLSLQETVPEFLEKIKEKFPDGIARARMIKTGFTSFDNIFGGLRKGALIYLGARPSMGKTTLSLQWAFNIAKHQGPVFYASLEVAQDELLSKLLALQSFVSTRTIEQGPIEPGQLRKLEEACYEMSQVPLHYTCEMTNISAIKNEASKIKDARGLAAIFIDRIELLESPDAESRNVQLSRISADLNRMAIDLDVPVVVLCQLSRATARRGKAQVHKPILSDLRDSGSLEQDAKMVVAIHRESMYDGSDNFMDDTDIIVLKNMFGATGSLDVWFRKSIPMFSEKEKKREDEDDD